jgi:RNA polymerase sigma factor (sigma-70 family)
MTEENAKYTLTQKEREDFEILWNGSKDRLYRLAYRLTGDTDKANDLLQEAAINCFRGYEKFLHKDDDEFLQKGFFLGWSMRVLYNQFASDFRTDKRRSALQLDESMYELEDPSAHVDEQIGDYVTRRELIRAIKRLSQHHRDAFILCEIKQLSYSDSAALLRVPEGTIKSRMSRAREYLKVALSHLDLSKPQQPIPIVQQRAVRNGPRYVP